MNNIIVYNDKNEPINLNLDWSRKQNKYFSGIHGISSYLAMFGPAMPSYFIKKYSNEGDLVMDNFSGRGTTALVARELNRKFAGNDLNPYAYVLSKFKISKISKNVILKQLEIMRTKYLQSEYRFIKIDKNSQNVNEMLYFYSEETYRQLLFIRDNYGKLWHSASSAVNAILAFALGLMHGPTKKNGETIYFSLKMPNTISMSPNYVKNYAAKNNLIRPNVNIFDNLNNRIIRKYDDIMMKDFDAKIFLQDSTKENRYIKNESVSLVITSPPYLNIVNYTTSNWLKLWLLGYDRSNLSKEIKLSDNLKFDNYVEFIKKYLNSISMKIKKSGKVCIIVGDIFNRSLIEEVWNQIKLDVPYNFVSLYIDNKYAQNRKVTNMLQSKTGRATKVEKVLVLEKR